MLEWIVSFILLVILLSFNFYITAQWVKVSKNYKISYLLLFFIIILLIIAWTGAIKCIIDFLYLTSSMII